MDNRTEANTKVFGQGTQRVALPEPSLQIRGQAIPMFAFSHQVGTQRVALPEPNLQTRTTRQCLQAEYFHRAWGQLVWLNSAWKYDKASASGGRPIWTNPNLQSRVSELHPDMPRVSTRKSRDCFLVWDLSYEADLTQAWRAT